MIGVFDSGIGGLTVLRALRDALPEENFLYFGDSAYAPYGRRSETEVKFLTRRGVEQLFRRGCRLVVIACNTAAACALRELQQDWLPRTYPDRRILGVFVPLVEAVAGTSWNGSLMPNWRMRNIRTLAFFATRRTVESGAFEAEMKRLSPRTRVFSQGCPRLAEAIEVGWSAQDIDRGIDRYVGSLRVKLGPRQLDAAILGCTHYPLVADVFRSKLPVGTLLLDQPSLVSQSLKTYLSRHPEFRRGEGEASGCRYLTSGDPERVCLSVSRFLNGDSPPFEYLRADGRDDKGPPASEGAMSPTDVVRR